jgi:glyoxylase-like metal-dependent hydrolase (beta-lactamase superfamily II)
MHPANFLRTLRGRRWPAVVVLLLVLAGTSLAQTPPLAGAKLARLQRGGGPLPQGRAVAVSFAGTLDYEGHYARPHETKPYHSLRRIVVAAPLLARQDWTTWSDADTTRTTETTLLLGGRALRRDAAGAPFRELGVREAGEALAAIVSAAPPFAVAYISTWNGRGLAGGPMSVYQTQYTWPDPFGRSEWDLDSFDQPYAHGVLRTDPRRGAFVQETHIFGDTTVNGRVWPDSVRSAGFPADASWMLYERLVAVEDSVSLAELAAPDSVAPAAPAADTTARVVAVAPGAWAVELPDADTRSLAVEFADHLVLLETSCDNDHGERIAAALRARFPGKPVRFVSFSHHHPDYVGGLRPFLADSAEVVCSSAVAQFVYEIGHLNFSVAPDRLWRRCADGCTVRFDTLVAGRWRHADATNELVALDIGARSNHTDAYVVFWLPRQRVLFEGDLGFSTANGSLRASRRAAGLLQALAAAKIAPETVVQSWPVNGNAASVPFATLRALVAARAKP